LIIESLELDNAVQVISQGGVVAFPTETYYGLGVDPFNPQALAKLFAIKKRPSVKPVLTLIAGQEQLTLLTSEIPSLFQSLFPLWPAPLTLVFKALPALPATLTGGTGTVAVRVSPHPVAMALVRACHHPLTATSANISGEPPAVTADEVRLYFGDTVDLVIDGGRTPGGKPSTVVGIDNDVITILREGVISLSKIERTISL
jgi:L-threonylcarbamoyladenylate synthase